MFKTAIKLDEDAISFLATAAAKDYLENNTPPAEAIAKVILEQGYDLTPEQVSRIVEKTNNYIYLYLLKTKKGPPKFPVAKRDDVLKIIDEKIHSPSEKTAQNSISSLLEKKFKDYSDLFDRYIEELLAKTGSKEIEQEKIAERPVPYFEVIDDLKRFKLIVEDEIEKVETARFENLTNMVKQAASNIVNNEMKLSDFVNFVIKSANNEVLAQEIILELDKELNRLGFNKYATQPQYLIRQSPAQYTYMLSTIMDQDAYRDALMKLPTVTNDWIMYLEKTMSDLIEMNKVAESVPESILIKIINDIIVPAHNAGLFKKSQEAAMWAKSTLSKPSWFKRLFKKLPKSNVGWALFGTLFEPGLKI
jgi:DNA-binding TFAR19-related protein (PDSD5 family)